MSSKLFPSVRGALKHLLDEIKANGELDVFWNAVDKENDKARKAARKVERERKKIAMGSEYNESSSAQSEEEVL